MKLLKNIFWDSESKRIRAGFRIGLFIITIIIVGLAFNLLFKSVSSGFELDAEAPLYLFWMSSISVFFEGVFAVWFIGRFFDKRKLSEFGLDINTKWFKDLAFGIYLGAFLILGIFLVEVALGWIKIIGVFHLGKAHKSLIGSFITIAFVFIATATLQELLLRGYILKNLSEGLTSKKISPEKASILGVIILTILLGILEIFNSDANLISTINLLVSTVVFCIAYITTKQLATSIGLNAGWNVYQGIVFGYPSDGLEYAADIVSIFKIELSGFDVLTGGALGICSGIFGTIALIIALLVLLLRFRLRRVIPARGK